MYPDFIPMLLNGFAYILIITGVVFVVYEIVKNKKAFLEYLEGFGYALLFILLCAILIAFVYEFGVFVISILNLPKIF
jgi:hypothetical protein